MTAVGGVVMGVLVVVALAAILPPHTIDLASHPAPATDYQTAVRHAEQRQVADDSVAVLGGRSILMTHGQRTARVVVLFHGLTNSPRQYLHVAERLYALGDNVYVPRLPHHAERNGTARTLARLTAEELTQFADSAIDLANGLGDSVIAVGVSAGATVAAWVAQQRPDVDRAVLAAPLLQIGRVPSILATPLMNLALRVPNVTRRESPDPVRPDRELGVSTRAVAELLRLGSAVCALARRTPPRTREIVFVVNENDHTVKTAPALELARRWTAGLAAVTMYQFPRSLNLPHDIAEEAHPNADTAVVYPALEALIHGEPPPLILSSHRLWPPA